MSSTSGRARWMISATLRSCGSLPVERSWTSWPSLFLLTDALNVAKRTSRSPCRPCPLSADAGRRGAECDRRGHCECQAPANPGSHCFPFCRERARLRALGVAEVKRLQTFGCQGENSPPPAAGAGEAAAGWAGGGAEDPLGAEDPVGSNSSGRTRWWGWRCGLRLRRRGRRRVWRRGWLGCGVGRRGKRNGRVLGRFGGGLGAAVPARPGPRGRRGRGSRTRRAPCRRRPGPPRRPPPPPPSGPWRAPPRHAPLAQRRRLVLGRSDQRLEQAAHRARRGRPRPQRRRRHDARHPARRRPELAQRARGSSGRSACAGAAARGPRRSPRRRPAPTAAARSARTRRRARFRTPAAGTPAAPR